jgi:pimeloyl-ACP methyl ester carboxylesterase
MSPPDVSVGLKCVEAEPRTMIASEKGGRGAEKHRGRSAFLDQQVERAMHELLALGGVRAESHKWTVRGIELHYLDAGAGDVVIMLHGASGGAANWYRLIGPLSESLRIIAIDLPGFGLSDSIEPEPPLAQHVARLLAELLEQIGVRPEYVIGTSFGGLVAARLAQITDAEKLIMINPAGLWPEVSMKLRIACIPMFQRLALKQTRAGARWLLRNVLLAQRLPRDHEERLVDYIYWSAERTDLRSLARAYSMFGGVRGQSEVLTAEELGQMASRTLVLWGDADRFLPAPRARREAVLASGVQLRMIPRAGHSPNWEAPALVLNHIMSFLGLLSEQKESEGSS